jgi:hypothetical protein
MIDAYSNGPISEATVEDCLYFDQPYSDEEMMTYGILSNQRTGRLRHRIFNMWQANLAKSPMVKMADDVSISNGFHYASGESIKRSRYVGAIVHAKYTQTFHAYVRDILDRGVSLQHEYRLYNDGMKSCGTMWHPKFSLEIGGRADLFERGLMSDDYIVMGEGRHIQGDHFYHGTDGHPVDHKKASELWAADGRIGNKQCCKNMAWAFRDGIGVEPDPSVASWWWRESQ